MRTYKLLSWNVNGIRAIAKKGFSDWVKEEGPDIMCVQETKVQAGQIDAESLGLQEYSHYWNYAEKKGYSGVAVFTTEKPDKVEYGFGIDEFDSEGRTLVLKYEHFTLLNIYFPKGDTAPARLHRLKYKLDFYDAFLHYVDACKERGEKLIICGDFNTAHKEMDLARPKENEKNSGFLPEEREWIDRFVSHGYIDIFRRFNKEPDHYTWWDFKTRARERNIGWRIDYFLVSDDLVDSVSKSFILSDVMGSDHCPIGIILTV
jgi:exodeoxyribonuclease-3